MPDIVSGEIGAMVEAGHRALEAGDGLAALQCFLGVLQQDLGCAEAFLGSGYALELMGDEEGARASYRHAASVAPSLAEAHGALAALAARRRDWPSVRSSADLALAIRPGQPAACIALALQDLHEGRPGDVPARLDPVVAGAEAGVLQRAHALRTRAEALDRLGRTEAAFADFAASAEIFRRTYAGACAGPQPMAGLDLCQSLVRQYAAAGPELWRPAPGATRAPAAGHVFLLGFPRSGTTLLEQVLAGHPQVTALEERPILAPAIDAYLDPPVGVAALAQMDEAAAETRRAAYWERAATFGAQVEGKVFVDKQPFYSLWLPLIGKLFPDAKIIVARRDPRDVVFSCFRNPFRMTPVTYELMDIERGAALYLGAMQALELFLAETQNPVFLYRHEDLVDRFDETLDGLCDFLGLERDGRMAQFDRTALVRDIRTPSAAQVAKGLNRDGVGAWRRYAAQLQPILAPLSAIAQRYGYAS